MQFTLEPLVVRHLQGDLKIDGRHIVLTDATGQFYGGQVSGMFDAELSASPGLSSRLGFLARGYFFARCRDAGARRIYGGIRGGQLSFVARGANRTDLLASLTCQGSVKADSPELVNFDLSKALGGRPQSSGSTRFQNGVATFSCAQRKIDIQSLGLATDSDTSVNASGTIDFSRNLDLRFSAPDGLIPPHRIARRAKSCCCRRLRSDVPASVGLPRSRAYASVLSMQSRRVNPVRFALFVCLTLFTLALAATAGVRVRFAPKFVPGEVLRYRIESRTTTTGTTTTPIVNPEGGSKSIQTIHMVVRLETRGVSTDGKVRFHATYEKSSAESETDALDLAATSFTDQYNRLEGRSVEFTLQPERSIHGLPGCKRSRFRPTDRWPAERGPIRGRIGASTAAGAFSRQLVSAEGRRHRTEMDKRAADCGSVALRPRRGAPIPRICATKHAVLPPHRRLPAVQRARVRTTAP